MMKLSIKAVIVNQQLYIEKIEYEKRKLNVVINNIPEESLNVDETALDTDKEKVKYLSSIIHDDEYYSPPVERIHRLGRKQQGRNRPLLVRFSRQSDRDDFLFDQKKLRSNSKCSANLGFIYVNRDSTFLVRKEEKRLRDRLKEMRRNKSENDKLYIKKDKLYLNDDVVDAMNIAHQLF